MYPRAGPGLRCWKTLLPHHKRLWPLKEPSGYPGLTGLFSKGLLLLCNGSWRQVSLGSLNLEYLLVMSAHFSSLFLVPRTELGHINPPWRPHSRPGIFWRRPPLTTPFCLVLWWLRLWETRTGPVTEGGEAFASRTSMELQLALQKRDTTGLKNAAKTDPLLRLLSVPFASQKQTKQGEVHLK